MRNALCVLLLIVAGTIPIRAAGQYADDGRVEEPARSILAAAYDSTLEHGWCVTAWHVAADTILVVTGIAPSVNTRGAGRDWLIFDCEIDQPPLHTHPPEWPYPSPTDVREGLIDHRNVPFIVVQSKPDRFAFLVLWRRIIP